MSSSSLEEERQDGAAVQHVLDGLPYIDPVLEDYEDYASALIEEEMKKGGEAEMRRSDARLPRLPPPAGERTELLRAEYRRVSASADAAGAVSKPDFGVASLEAPPEEDRGSVRAWEGAVKRARLAYETERIRAVVLQVEKEESSDVWKAWLERMGATIRAVQEKLARERDGVEVINASRKSDQLNNKQKELHVLTTQYLELLSKRMQLKRAISSMKDEISIEQEKSA